MSESDKASYISTANSGVGKKSVNETTSKVLAYCAASSTPMHPVQLKLKEETEKHPWSMMLGASEVLRLNATFIRAMGAKKVLDIGVFTGASSLSAGLALPEDGHIVACDTSVEDTDKARAYWKEAGVEDKVDLVIAPAAQTLAKLVEKGEAGSFDFAFIDADKGNYDNYYESCLILLRKGGIISIDNTLWSGKVLDPMDKDESTMALKALNDKLAKDTRVSVTQLNIGDGLTLVVKL